MRIRAMTLLCAAWLLLGSAGAWGQSYQLLDGNLTDAATGQTRALSGWFDASLSEFSDPSVPPTVLIVDDFAFQAGERSFTPRGPIEYDGLTPSPFLSIADQIHVEGDAVGFFRLHAGGLITVGDDEVTFQTFEFRADAAPAGRAVGQQGDGPSPRRLHLQGTLYRVDQSFRLPGTCEPPVFELPPGDGGVVIGGTIIEYGSFDISDHESVLFVSPGPGPPLNRVTGGDPSQIGGTIQIGGSVVLLNPVGLFLPNDATVSILDVTASRSAAPTLEQLGITAPAGADVTLDANGALTVTTAGDLFVAGGGLDLPGLTSITLVAGGNISFDGAVELPPDVTLSLDTGSGLPDRIGDGPPGNLVGPLALFPCERLTPLPAEKQEVGTFSIVATAAQPVEIDVQPWRRDNRVRPGRGVLPVALLGSPDLDVRDVLPASLRLGGGEAAPIGRAFRFRSNRDRHADLLAFFRVRDAEIAFGDAMVCLTGEKADGTVVEGCDAIDTAPRRRRAR